MLIILLMIGFIQYMFLRYRLFYFSWIFLYAIGYYFALAGKRAKIVFFVCTSVALVFVLSLINWHLILDVSSWQTRALHDLLGFELFIVGVALFSLHSIKNKYLIKKLDSYTFPIYITHAVFIFGPFSLLGVSNIYVSILLIMAVTLLSAFALDWVSKKITHLCCLNAV